MFHGRFSGFDLVEQSNQRTTVFSQGGFIALLLIGGSGLPAFPDDALPFVGRGCGRDPQSKLVKRIFDEICEEFKGN